MWGEMWGEKWGGAWAEKWGGGVGRADGCDRIAVLHSWFASAFDLTRRRVRLAWRAVSSTALLSACVGVGMVVRGALNCDMRLGAFAR
jgi:hypothetical protein